jgi:hypothetical protein
MNQDFARTDVQSTTTQAKPEDFQNIPFQNFSIRAFTSF